MSTLTIRLYAAAADAAGTHELTVPLEKPSRPLAEVLEELSQRGESLQRVCRQSSFLVNGTRTPVEKGTVAAGDVVDVLPPFAGG